MRDGGATEIVLVNNLTSTSDTDSYSMAENKLTNVDAILENYVSSVGPYLFASVLSGAPVNVRNGVFAWNEISSLTIPYGTLKIYNFTFQYNQISTISLPSTLQEIGTSAFQNNQISTISLPSTLEKN